MRAKKTSSNTWNFSNVYEVQTTSGIYDDGETYEYLVYICYPGATLTIVNADMSDPTYEEDSATPAMGCI